MSHENPEREINSEAEEATASVFGSQRELLNKFILEPIKEHGRQVAAECCKNYLKALKIDPRFLHEADPAFHLDRQRLNSDPGLVIANHPGYFVDSFLIFSQIERSDFQIVVSKNGAPFFARILGDERVVVAESGFSGLRRQMRKIETHQAHGGITFLYPTGGEDAVFRNNPDAHFKDGFAFLLEHTLKETDMVYSFHINPEDVAHALSERLRNDLAAPNTGTLDRIIDTSSIHDNTLIRVKESVLSAEKWRGALQGVVSSERNKKLTEYFRAQFKDSI